MSLEDYLPTNPENATPAQIAAVQQYYMPPEQIAQMRQYSDALTKGGQRDQPITSPWQGVRMMADALSGNIMRNRAGQQQMANLGLDSDTRGMQNVPGASAQSQASAQASAPVANAGVASVRNNNPGAQWPGPIASQFGSTGSQTIGGGNKIATFDDPVKGAAAEFALLDKRYLGMPLGTAVAKWSGGNSPGAYAQHIAQQTGLTPDTVLTPQLLRSPQGIALGKAMADWEAGGKSPLTDQQWTQAHQLAFAGAGGGQTADASGHIGGTSPPQIGSPQAMSGALAANTRPPSGAGPAEPPIAAHGNPTFGAQYAPSLPQVSPEMMQRIWRSPTISPEEKQMYYQQYMLQNQPVEAAGPGGRWVIPSGGGKPLWIPDLKNYKEGDYKIPATADQQGNLTVRPLGGGSTGAPLPVPQSWGRFGTPAPSAPQGQGATPTQGAAPTAPSPPTPGPQGAVTPLAGAPSVASAAPGGAPPPSMLSLMPPSLAGGGAQQPGAPPVRVASLEPNGGVKSDASPGAPPAQAPMMPPVGQGGPQGAPPAGPQGTQVAQAGQAGPLGPFIDQLRQWDNTMNAQKAGAAAQAEGMAKASEEERTGINEAAKKSGTQMSQLQTALKLTDDPNFVSGLINTPGTILQKARALLGSNPNAARAIETFDKIIAGATLPEVTSQTKGTGQVRLAEFNTVKGSIANRNLTIPGIKAVLGIMMAAHQQNIDVSDLASAFSQGMRIGPDGKPFNSGKQGLNDPEWQPTLNRYLEAHPVITPELRANWEKSFGSRNLAQETARTLAGMQGNQSSGLPPAAATTGHPQPMATPAAGFNQSAPPPPPGFR